MTIARSGLWAAPHVTGAFDRDRVVLSCRPTQTSLFVLTQGHLPIATLLQTDEGRDNGRRRHETVPHPATRNLDGRNANAGTLLSGEDFDAPARTRLTPARANLRAL
jgi:hypothetical protein